MVDLAKTVTEAQDGSSEAFNHLVRATYEDTYSLAFRLTGNHHDAHDVAQDTYLRAFRGLRRFRGDANFATWLYRITANCASNLIARRRKGSHEPLSDEFTDERPEHDPHARAEAEDLRTSVVAALSRLPAKLRDVVVLRDVYDLPHEAIAGALGITESAAKVRLHRARRKLREELFDRAAEPVEQVAPVASPEPKNDVAVVDVPTAGGHEGAAA
jgi:RNA polymerase sigma-70 factor, ECF subfamily